MNVFIDTHEVVESLTRGGTFSAEQAERLKDVFGKQLQVVTKADLALTKAELETTMQGMVNKLLLAMIAMAGVILAGVQILLSVHI